MSYGTLGGAHLGCLRLPLGIHEGRQKFLQPLLSHPPKTQSFGDSEGFFTKANDALARIVLPVSPEQVVGWLSCQSAQLPLSDGLQRSKSSVLLRSHRPWRGRKIRNIWGHTASTAPRLRPGESCCSKHALSFSRPLQGGGPGMRWNAWVLKEEWTAVA